MMMMIESAMTVRFRAGANLCSSTSSHHHRTLDEATRVHATSHRHFLACSSSISWNTCRRLNKGGPTLLRRRSNVSKTRATTEHLGSTSDPRKRKGGARYHPFEDIAESTTANSDTGLTAAESTRTIIEVNSKATLMFTSPIDDEVHENIIWPDLPYVTDEHGNIYFQVKNDEDILQTLTSEDNFVQVIVGFDTMEMIKEMELLGPSEIDFGIEEIEDEDSDDEDEEEEGDEDEEDEDYDDDWVSVLEDGDDDDDEDDDDDDSDETLGDWAKLETMRSSHPMFFAKKLAEVASDDPIDWMQQPPAGLAIQGLLRPAFIEEHSDIQKRMSVNKFPNANTDQVVKAADDKLKDFEVINGHKRELGSSKDKDDSSMTEELEKDETPINGASFYKLEMIKIQLITAHGQQSDVEVDEVRKAQPDAIAHSAAKIISRLKDGGEKTMQALKSLCWRCKGIQVEEARIIGVDSLGFDVRACSGTQIQTLRFAFNTQAPSEYSAERQLNDLLFPRIHKSQKKIQAHQNEC